MFCHRRQEFIAEHGITVESRDITKDPPALEDLKKLGFVAMPVTAIDCEIVVGFDQGKLKRLLGLA